MPPLQEAANLAPLLRHGAASDADHGHRNHKRSKLGSGRGGGSIFKMFKLLPMLSTGCKMVALLGRPKHAMLPDSAATTVTFFGPRRGRVCLALQECPRSPPFFLLELPILTASLHKEMSSGLLKLALESETKTHRKKLAEEYVWVVYCNGRRSGFAIRRKSSSSEDEREVMKVLRGVSMGAGVLPERPGEEGDGSGDRLTYMRARFERLVGSKDSEALYMISPDGAAGPDLSIFLVRAKG
ncbi:protein MIZU-KUSSEI 1 [Iris pallida]|uniref:Protein MIZU-KUSSEI 1 n=1 Tax=Iris pallida TaxID=29817 RepID=A0AAX6HKD2_IRIPA|nr:protein MIZU-KUSSEI 1 [Iris pallida]